MVKRHSAWLPSWFEVVTLLLLAIALFFTWRVNRMMEAAGRSMPASAVQAGR